MTPVREAIFAEIVNRLTKVDGVAEVERMPFIDPLIFPALHIFDDGQRVSEVGISTSTYDLSITVEGYLEAQGGGAAHAALHALYAASVAKLITEPPLGGLVETIDEGAMRIMVAPIASKSRLCFSLDVNITYAARRDDPAQPA